MCDNVVITDIIIVLHDCTVILFLHVLLYRAIILFMVYLMYNLIYLFILIKMFTLLSYIYDFLIGSGHEKQFTSVYL